MNTSSGERQLSRHQRLLVALEQDGPFCVWCRRDLEPGSPDASVDHLVPKLKGGPSWFENEVAACRSCNRKRGHSSPVDWFRACRERGLSPNLDLIHARLTSLSLAIAKRGGQRRARPYLASQIQRMALLLRDS